jgi:hypothetical protein
MEIKQNRLPVAEREHKLNPISESSTSSRSLSSSYSWADSSSEPADASTGGSKLFSFVWLES